MHQKIPIQKKSWECFSRKSNAKLTLRITQEPLSGKKYTSIIKKTLVFPQKTVWFLHGMRLACVDAYLIPCVREICLHALAEKYSECFLFGESKNHFRLVFAWESVLHVTPVLRTRHLKLDFLPGVIFQIVPPGRRLER